MLTEPETRAPSTAKPAIEAFSAFGGYDEAEDAYVAAVGSVAFAWNTLHEQLGALFVAVSGMERKVALTKWYSIRSDLHKRAMLRDRRSRAAGLSGCTKRLPKAPEDLKWLLDRAHDLAEDRNNAVHAPCSLLISESGSEMVAAFFDGNPLAKRLMGKELLVEFAWCEAYAETLTKFTRIIGLAIALPDHYQWPERPKILSRENFSGESRRALGAGPPRPRSAE